jgi:hypothetical protein
MPKINNFEVIAQFAIEKRSGTRPGRFVIVDRGDGYVDRWVSTTQYRTGTRWDREWSQGHYFNRLSQALEHFHSRCRIEVGG